MFKNLMPRFPESLFIGMVGVFIIFSPFIAEAALSSIAVTPASSTIAIGATKQFNAIGTFSDGSTKVLNIGALATSVAAGEVHTCVALSDGTVKCWGLNQYGQVGNGTLYFQSSPVLVGGISTASFVAAGTFDTCALLSDGTVKCWGYNNAGQLGNGTTSNSSFPVIVSGIHSAISIASGYYLTCALLSDGTVKCWGANDYGGLGNGTFTNSSTPVIVNGISTATNITTGRLHSCALLSDSTVKCWGLNQSGQLGLGNTSFGVSIPTLVPGVSGVTSITASDENTCALLADGTVKCWGNNSPTPVIVNGISAATAIAMGPHHSCALLSGGTVKCWGYNREGQLGNGTYTDSYTPVSVGGIFNATAIIAGSAHSCALLSDGTVKCWGNGRMYGRLTDSAIPVPVPNIPVSIIWSSSNATASTIINDGTATSFSLGTTTITAFFDGILGSTLLTVGEPQNFWSQLINSSQGWLNLRATYGSQNKRADDIIKTVPTDWVLKVATTTDATGNSIDVDGYRWYGVADVTDSAVGWMQAKDLINGTVYLPYDVNIQALLETKATTTPTREARTPVIVQAVDNYYTQTNVASSLYGGGGGYDGLNNFQRFIQGANFPKELVLAIAGHESAGTLDNEICASARDGGIGIMQITSEGFKGLGSALKNYPKMNDCRANITSSKYYSNALQGIYASIKDGFRTLQEKYRKKCPAAQLTIGALTYTCQDIERVLTTWAYNGKVLTGNYLKQISDALRDLSMYFPGITYANNDQLIEKLKLANANRIEFKKFSPVEIEVVDSQGRITGFDGTPIIREEIPFSRYDREADGGVVFFPQNPYTYRVIGTGPGTYGFRVEFTKEDALRVFYATNIPIVPGEIHEYFIDWDALDRGERGVTVRIDTNGDGVVDRVVQSDGMLTEIVPPTITVTSLLGEYLLNATTTVQFTATDASGIATVDATLNGTSVINGQVVMLTKPGVNIIEVTAMDNEGNTATTTSTFKVLYATNGFLSPVKSDGTGVYNQGRTLPVKFNLSDASGAPISGALGYLYLAKISNNIVDNDEVPLSVSSADTGNQFRYDSNGRMYIFNLSTNTMTLGTWQIKAVLDSGQEIKAKVLIK